MLQQVRRIPRVVISNRPFSSGNDWWGDNPGGDDKGSLKKSIFDDVEDLPDTTPTSLRKNEKIVRKSTLFSAAPQRRQPVVDGTPKISISQALYLAKEAGVFTTRELQTHFIKSPSFSTDKKSPLLLENFFLPAEQVGSDPYSADLKVARSVTPQATLASSAVEQVATDQVSAADIVPDAVHAALSSVSARRVCTFGARGREWKVRAEGKGTRKRSTAHVVIERGTGVVKVNGEEDFFKRWPLLHNRFDVLFPFEACGAAGLFDVYIAVKGGGISGQAGAARLAVGRALVDACAQCEDGLKDSLVLYEDTRQRTSKFPGKKGAYARWNWTLR